MSRQSELAQLGRVFDTGPLSNRNLIINGAMQVAQRGTSQTSISAGGFYTVDRFDMGSAGSGVWTMTQDTNAPSGFAYSVKCECTTAAASPLAGDETRLSVKLEAQNLQLLNYGSADAEKITLSFWVKSNKTGTGAIWIYQHDAARSASPNYTINAADTWEYKTITIPADTAGTINNDNGLGLEIGWYLSAGSSVQGSTANAWVSGANPRMSSSDINFADATSNYIQITGVQLEVGDTATPFEHRSYGDELQRCQRYYLSSGGSTNNLYAFQYVSSHKFCQLVFPVEMRATPTNVTPFNNGSFTTYQPDKAHWKAYVSSSYTDGSSYYLTGYSFDAEL